VIASNTLVGNRYRVVRPLGGGGMKQVYLAADTRLANRPCALAEMIDSFADPKDRQTAVAAFHREADMLAGLAHDRIVRIYDKLSEGNRHFLVMEYVEGETLEEKLKAAGGRLDESTTTDIALQVLDAIEYLHSRTPPVIYRDLKPSNVIVSPDGRAKLVDFGIARFFQPQATATMVGTQGYAPPEQYKGKVEARSDLYALGATMHFMLTGRDPALEPPFMFPPVQELCPGCNPTLADLVTEALALDLKDRMSSGADFKRRLTRLKYPTATSIAVPRNPRQAAASAPTVVPLDAPLCANCAKPIPGDARFCPYCSADLAPAPQLSPPDRAGTAARVIFWAGSILAVFAVAFAGVYYYQQSQREQQRIAAARENPLVFKQLTLALSTRTGQAIAPPATSFKDTEIANNKYLKWSATFDNTLAGVGSGSEKVEARFYDPSGNQVASSDTERMLGENDKSVDFSAVALMPEAAAKTLGQYRVALYAGDQMLAQQNFTIAEDLAAKAKAKAAAETAEKKHLRQVQEEKRKALAVASGPIAHPTSRAGEHPTVGRTFRDCDECPEMVVVPAGSFTMGSPSSEAGRYDQEGPQHHVTIGYSFAVGKYPVTRDEYARFVEATGHSNEDWRNPSFPQTGRDPVVNVNWDDAKAYVGWLGEKAGHTYRLVSEAEYEYAERAGTSTAYWWGDSDADLCRYANGGPCNHDGTVPVGSYPANAFGLYDMAGNVWEWTEDCWNRGYADAPDNGAAWMTGDCGLRVQRGGSWLNLPRSLRSAYHGGVNSFYRVNGIGFRVARTL
jgi:formylglycine-generating enzyme required for sulfatase activity